VAENNSAKRRLALFNLATLRQYRSAIVVGLLAAILIGRVIWSGFGSEISRIWDGTFVRRWSEEVVLSDGSLIVVKRAVEVSESNSFAGDAYNAVEQDATLKFTGELGDLPVWNAALMAQVLYRDEETEEWVIVANSTSCEVYYERGEPRFLFLEGRPQTNYFEFRLRKNGWAQVPISRASIGRPTNLLMAYNDIGLTRMSASKKRRLLAAESAEQYRSVVAVSDSCTNSSLAKPIWEIEDTILGRLDRLNATNQERDLAGQLFASTRLIYADSYYDPDATAQDSDSRTVQLVTDRRLNGGKPGVSADGQVIYQGTAADEVANLRESYWRRLRATGLGRFVPD
jgi:hypothetical protein